MINYDLRKIRTIIFDVDGVLSASTIPMDNEGIPCRTANIKDGYAIHMAVTQTPLLLAIITGGKQEAVRRRYEGLGMKEVHLGASMKMEVYEQLKAKYQLRDEEVLYMGDDIPDRPVMQRVGCPCCPADAAAEIKEVSCYISHLRGGEGCVRDVIEQVLKAQGLWMADDKAFGW